MTQDIVLTQREASVLVKLSVKTLYRMARRGELPVIRVGRSVRIRRDTLLAVLDQAETAG